MGVASSHIRVTIFGVPLYTLREQYALGTDGRSVRVRGYERIGPFGVGGINIKNHSGKVAVDGLHAQYTVPINGVDWIADYTTDADGKLVTSILRSDWGRATEAMKRV